MGQNGVNKETIQTTVSLSDGGTVVIRNEVPRKSVVEVRGEGVSRREEMMTTCESLWIITAHIVRADTKPGEANPASPKQVPVMPPARR